MLFLTTIFAWSAFAIDLALALMARERLSHLLGISGYLGNGLWLALGGAVSRAFFAPESNTTLRRQAVLWYYLCVIDDRTQAHRWNIGLC